HSPPTTRHLHSFPTRRSSDLSKPLSRRGVRPGVMWITAWRLPLPMQGMRTGHEYWLMVWAGGSPKTQLFSSLTFRHFGQSLRSFVQTRSRRLIFLGSLLRMSWVCRLLVVTIGPVCTPFMCAEKLILPHTRAKKQQQSFRES